MSKEGSRKKLCELKEGSFFVFTDRKKMPCVYNGMSTWKNHPIYLWSELKSYSCWTQEGKERLVIDYGDELPADLKEKYYNYQHKTIGSPF